MKYYEVETRFFDNGKVEAVIFEKDAKQMPESHYAETAACDIYTNCFENRKDAEQYRQDALNA